MFYYYLETPFDVNNEAQLSIISPNTKKPFSWFATSTVAQQSEVCEIAFMMRLA